MQAILQKLNRRALLGGMGVIGMSGIISGCAHTSGSAPLFFSGERKIGLQLYTLGDEAGEDLNATFAAVAKFGYRDIELPGLYGRQPAAIRKAAESAGLVISSLHVPPMARGPGVNLQSFASEIADTVSALGARKAVAPIHLFPENFRPGKDESFQEAIGRSMAAAGGDIWRRTADLLNTKAAELKPLGISLGYHNHNTEFAKVEGTTGWDILVSRTEPSLVEFEVDLGWIATAGLDPAEFIKRYAPRVTQLHLKDVARENKVNFALQMSPATVGTGEQNWPAILAAAAKAGVRHYYLEQEPPFPASRMEAAEQGCAFLSQVKASQVIV